jgi:flagellar motor protein MotB
MRKKLQDPVQSTVQPTVTTTSSSSSTSESTPLTSNGGDSPPYVIVRKPQDATDTMTQSPDVPAAFAASVAVIDSPTPPAQSPAATPDSPTAAQQLPAAKLAIDMGDPATATDSPTAAQPPATLADSPTTPAQPPAAATGSKMPQDFADLNKYYQQVQKAHAEAIKAMQKSHEDAEKAANTLLEKHIDEKNDLESKIDQAQQKIAKVVDFNSNVAYIIENSQIFTKMINEGLYQVGANYTLAEASSEVKVVMHAATTIANSYLTENYTPLARTAAYALKESNILDNLEVEDTFVKCALQVAPTAIILGFTQVYALPIMFTLTGMSYVKCLAQENNEYVPEVLKSPTVISAIDYTERAISIFSAKNMLVQIGEAAKLADRWGAFDHKFFETLIHLMKNYKPYVPEDTDSTLNLNNDEQVAKPLSADETQPESIPAPEQPLCWCRVTT